MLLDAPVALDAMGGDRAPEAVVQGAISVAREGLPVALVGDPERLHELLDSHRADAALPLSLVPARTTVDMAAAPLDAARRLTDSSQRIALDLVASGRACAAVSAGNSGAFMAAGVLALGRLPGIRRPAVATRFPTLGGSGEAILVDSGANVDCSADHLVEFALMGSAYARRVLGAARPRVGLLANGTEEGKGDALTRAAHERLRETPIEYAGRVEGRDLFSGQIDVVVCDGFVGNVVLKTIEGAVQTVSDLYRREIGGDPWAALGALAARPALSRALERLNWERYGGAPCLGLDGAVVLAHGASGPTAVANAVKVAAATARSAVASAIRQTVADQGRV